jgi:preprotein translocase subunit Sec63
VAAANHYKLLQLAPDASPQELRQAFRRLSKRYHPDTTELPADQAEEAFRQLQLAYLTLSDPERRRVYDSSLQSEVAPLRPIRLTVPQPVPVRRPLSGGEWFALLLLGLAVVFSLVLGVGLAWARGTELLREPSWWPGGEQTAQTLPSTAADVVPAAPSGAVVQPSTAGA